MSRIIIIQGDWVTKKIPVHNKTVRVLKNGRVVPTWLAMARKASKV